MEQLLLSTHLYRAEAFQLIFEDKNGERFLYPLFIIGQLEGVANFPRSQSPLSVVELRLEVCCVRVQIPSMPRSVALKRGFVCF